MSLPGEVRRSGFVAVAGRTNAGKSTLVNRLVGEHVAIVSPVVQTTRRLVRAALTVDDAQIVFVDLPGSQRPVDRLTERMQSAVRRELEDVDVILWVIDAADEPGRGEQIVADMVLSAGVPVVIAANKVDRTKPDRLVERIAKIAELVGERPYHALVPVSAISGDGANELVRELVAALPEGGAWYPEGETTDMRVEERIAEYVREAALHQLREELPHAMIATVDELDEGDDGTLRVEATIWVERESQVGIVVGRGGEMIRRIGIDARQAVEQALGVHVYLRARVKVRKAWRDDDAWLARAGL